MKTPIRNPLFKTKSNSVLESLIPRGSVVESFAFYSGDVEFYLANRGRFVSAYTEKDVVYDVWSTLLSGTTAAAEISSRILPFKDEKEFPLLQEEWSKFRNPDVRAALFYFLNNCSDSGYISKGNMNTTNYNPVSLSRLKKFTKPEHFHLSKTDNTIVQVQESDADIVFAQFPKFIKSFLEEGINRGIEEESLSVESLAIALKDKKYVLLTEPTKFLSDMFSCNFTFVDQYGRKTTEQNAKEVILHNV
jgi:hypothetical protein